MKYKEIQYIKSVFINKKFSVSKYCIIKDAILVRDAINNFYMLRKEEESNEYAYALLGNVCLCDSIKISFERGLIFSITPYTVDIVGPDTLQIVKQIPIINKRKDDPNIFDKCYKVFNTQNFSIICDKFYNIRLFNKNSFTWKH